MTDANGLAAGNIGVTITPFSMKAAMIARVSDVRQDSNEAQISRLDEYVKRNPKLVPWQRYEIKESSSRGERKQFREILDQIVADANRTKETVAVVFETVDRLQRSFKDMLVIDDLIKEGLIELHFYREGLVINKTSNSSEITRWEIGVLLAHSYILQLSDNVKRQFEQMRRNGKWTGRPPIGYKNIQRMNANGEVAEKDIVPDDNAHLVAKMFELFSTGGYSISTIWQKMTDLGLCGRTGRPLCRAEIGYMLKDSFYCGLAHSKRYGRYPHKYEPMVEKLVWENCQDILSGRRKRRKQIGRVYALKGLVLCASCGCLYSPEMHKGHVYYSCTNAKHNCRRIYAREEALLVPINSVLLALEQIPQQAQNNLIDALRDTSAGDRSFRMRETERLRGEYSRLETRKDALLDIYLDGAISKPEYDAKLEQLRAAQDRIHATLDTHTGGHSEYHRHVEAVLSLCRNLNRTFESSEPAEKSAVLRVLLQNASARGKELSFTLKKPFDAVFAFAQHPNLLRDLDAFRTPEWKTVCQELSSTSMLSVASRLMCAKKRCKIVPRSDGS